MTVTDHEILTPTTVAEAIASLHATSEQMMHAADKLLELAELREREPEIHPVVINDGNNGIYTVTKRAPWIASSIGILNPSSVAIYFSATESASALARSPSVPPNALLVLPLKADTVELAADPAALGANTAVAFLFRFFTVQPAFLGKGA